MYNKIDPVSLEIIWQRLVSIADEMDNSTIRTSFSTIVGESHDFGCVLMDEMGNGLSQAVWSPPQFCTMLPRTTRIIIDKFKKENIYEGDVFITNDPWIGSTHLPDYNLISPVFYKSQIVAFVGTVAHVSDVGGHLGDLEASDMFMEGLRVMPNKFYNKGKINEIIEEFISHNCRVPDLVMGDLKAIVGTHKIAKSKIIELHIDNKLNNLKNVSKQIRNLSTKVLEDKIKLIPDSETKYEIKCDGYLEEFILKLKMIIKGKNLIFDFTGSSEQQWHSAINAAYSISYATLVYPVKCMLAAKIPNNDGLIVPIKMIAPKGSIVNCTFPAPVKARAKVIKHIPPLVFGAFQSILPKEVISSAGGIFPIHFVGKTLEEKQFAVHMLPHGGLGAMYNSDGKYPSAYPHNSIVTPTEIIETKCPVRVESKEIIKNSCGAGKFRGGPGQKIVFKNIGTNIIKLTIRPDMIKYPATGLNGGISGLKGSVLLNNKIINDFKPIDWNPNDTVTLIVPGGGGYGDVKMRNKINIINDVINDIIDIKEAKLIYNCDIDKKEIDTIINERISTYLK
jgi:N-methylhydantoinase B|tara:strand:- start:1600 stop:3291 length:1692 start_codon:yes stop_codon:yes gene_type:complete